MIKQTQKNSSATDEFFCVYLTIFFRGLRLFEEKVQCIDVFRSLSKIFDSLFT